MILNSTIYRTLRKRVDPDLRLPLDEILGFAAGAHEGQYSPGGEEYIYHPVRVAYRVNQAYRKGNGVTPLWVLAGALCHDVLEDTPCSFDTLVENIGKRGAYLAQRLTDVYTPEGYPNMSRKERKAMECKRICALQADVDWVVKLADLVDNVGIKGGNNPKLSALVLAEKKDFIDLCRNTSGNPLIQYLVAQLDLAVALNLGD